MGKFKVGDEVYATLYLRGIDRHNVKCKVIRACSHGPYRLELGEELSINGYTYSIETIMYDVNSSNIALINLNNNQTKGGTMNQIIIKLFPKDTEAADLVERYLGSSFNNNKLSGIWSKGLEGDILALAKKMETDEKEKK